MIRNFLIHVLQTLWHHGIVHQYSCSFIPQQTGVVEHKNQYLLEIACTLLIHMRVRNFFWGMPFLPHVIWLSTCLDLFYAVWFLILFCVQKLFCSFYPKMLGSICFVHNNDLYKTKLDLFPFKRVFLGYSCT